MIGGAAVDIITGMPLTRGFGEHDIAGQDDLLEKMRMAGVSSSEAASTVVGLIVEILEQRIADVLAQDPQTRVCVEILRAIDAPQITARQAALNYVRKMRPLRGAETQKTPSNEENYP